MIVAIIAIVIVVWIICLITAKSPSAQPATPSTSETASSTVVMTNDNSAALTSADQSVTSSSSVDSDVNLIDNQMNGLNQDNTNVNSSVQ